MQCMDKVRVLLAQEDSDDEAELLRRSVLSGGLVRGSDDEDSDFD